MSRDVDSEGEGFKNEWFPLPKPMAVNTRLATAPPVISCVCVLSGLPNSTGY